jgi:hypothetical protein
MIRRRKEARQQQIQERACAVKGQRERIAVHAEADRDECIKAAQQVGEGCHPGTSARHAIAGRD